MEEVSKEEGHDGAGAEEQEGAAGDAGDHVGKRVDDDELCQPLHADGKHNAEGSYAIGKDFGGEKIQGIPFHERDSLLEPS